MNNPEKIWLMTTPVSAKNTMIPVAVSYTHLVNVTFEGKPCAVPAGKTVAAALLGDAHAGYTSIHPLTRAASPAAACEADMAVFLSLIHIW